MINIFEIGSELAIPKAGMVGVVEKAIIGTGGSVQYQMICYTRGERVQGLFNDFEVSPIEDKAPRCNLGFSPATIIKRQDVEVLVDKLNNLVDINAPDGVVVDVKILDTEEIKTYKDMIGK